MWLRALVVLALSVPTAALAQFRADAPQPALGMGVDTMPATGWGDRWKAPVPVIYRRWAEFLGSKAARYTSPGATPSPFWSVAEQQRWITFPLALNFVSRSAVPTVLDIRPATPGSDSVYVIKTLFQIGVGAGAQSLALIRVYAVREHGTWVFSNALPRVTRDWQRKTVGPFDYVFPLGYRFDSDRAARAAAFADSIASAFEVPKAAHIAYYLTDSPDEMNRIIGLDWFPSSTDGGAFSSGPNRLLVSGNPALGENYRHEIVHVVLGPIGLRGVNSLVWEGVATWLGGTLGMDPRAVRIEYAQFLRAHPDVTLESIFSQSYDQGFRPAGALLCQMVFERGGISAVKALLASGLSDDALKAGLGRLLGKSWADIQTEWRRRAMTPR
jgi:hypothetical protein